MKKYLAILTAIIAVILTSCSNDDITVKNTTVIRVNPKTVMSNFTYQLNAGDLDGVDSDSKLRIRLYIYDHNNKLVESQEQTVANYLTTGSFEVGLDSNEGYKAIVLTDVTTDKENLVKEYWAVTNQESLTSLTVEYTQNDNLVYGDQEVLGIAFQTIYPGENITINVKPAGAIILTQLWNLHSFDEFASYIWVRGSRGNGTIRFSSNDEITYNPILDIEPYFSAINLSQHHNFGWYSYKFIMPQKNFIFTLKLGDEDRVVQDAISYEAVTIESEQEYTFFVYFDPNDDGSGNIVWDFENVTNQTYESTKNIVLERAIDTDSAQALSFEAQSSWKLTELLKLNE